MRKMKNNMSELKPYYCLVAKKEGVGGVMDEFLGGVPVSENPDFKHFFALIQAHADYHKIDAATTINLFCNVTGVVALQITSEKNKWRYIVEACDVMEIDG